MNVQMKGKNECVVCCRDFGIVTHLRILHMKVPKVDRNGLIVNVNRIYHYYLMIRIV